MIKDRVANKYGYDTPDTPPQIYSAARLMSWQTRRANVEALEREMDEEGHKARDRSNPLRGTHNPPVEFMRVITVNDSGTVMFGDDSESDEDRLDEPSTSRARILMDALSEDVVDHEPAEDLDQDEPMDEDEDDFREPFDRVIHLSQAEKDHAEIRANGVHAPEHEHDPPTPSSTSTQEPSSPPPDTPRNGTPPLPRQLAGFAKQQPSEAPKEFPTPPVEYYLSTNGAPLKG